MANIVSTSQSKIYQIKKWLGLNESPDGDTHMKMGEAAEMRNFRITAENHLQIRPGYGVLSALAEGKEVKGLWSGYVNGVFHLVAACNGHLWDVDHTTGTATDRGAIHDGKTSFFGFANKLYILTGAWYYAWDGSGAPAEVEGYIPIVTTGAPPTGGGTLLEGINLLTGKKRAEYSPDGESTVFQLPENSIDEVLSAIAHPDRELADQVIARDDQIDDMERRIEDLMAELKAQYTIVIVTHNMQQAARIADRTAFFLKGEIVESGDTLKIFQKPEDKRTEDYITGRFG